MKKTISLLMSLALLLSLSVPVLAGANHEPSETMVLNSFSGEPLSSVSELSISPSRIRFDRCGQNFDFALEEVHIDTSDAKNIPGAQFYSGHVGNLFCNVTVYNGKYCIQVLDKSQSIENREKDTTNNFTIVVGEDVLQSQNKVSSKLRLQNEVMKSTPPATRASQLHVYASGRSVPGLISAGSAEGWCTASYMGNNNYRVYSLQYVVAYNWPSDGVSLWYDSIGNECAYSSPAWASSALTTVDGAWTISVFTGAFVAEVTISADVDGVPLMWTKYDRVLMDGSAA